MRFASRRARAQHRLGLVLAIPRYVLRRLWRIMRVLLLVGVAMGPGMPPPPLPKPQTTEEREDAGGQVKEDQ